jgi:hypothetical protein
MNAISEAVCLQRILEIMNWMQNHLIMLHCNNQSAFRLLKNLVYHGCEDFPGPNKLPTRSVFDLKLALSFNCQTRVCCCFITANCSVTSLLFVTVT